jgi:hypothetical protein
MKICDGDRSCVFPLLVDDLKDEETKDFMFFGKVNVRCFSNLTLQLGARILNPAGT